MTVVLDKSEAEQRLLALLPGLASALADLASERAAAQTESGVERLLRISDVAATLGVSRTTAYQLIGSGELRSLKLRGRRLVPTSAIAAFIQSFNLEA